MVMPSVCPMRGGGSSLRFWPVPWGCGRSEDMRCRMGWGVMYRPWTLGEAQQKRVLLDRECIAGSGRVSANVDSDMRGNPITGSALEPRPVPLSPCSNSPPTSRINLKKASAKMTNLNPPEAEVWGWGWWIDPRTGEITPPPAAEADTVVPLAPTATREKGSREVREPKVRKTLSGRCIVDGDVKVTYLGMR